MIRLVFIASFLLAFGFASTPALAQQDCPICGFEIEKKVHWGRHVFCSEDCRHEFYLERFRCKICNDRVDPSTVGNRRRSEYVIDLTPPKWDGFCDGCRQGVEDGQIDPAKDRYREEADTRPSPAPAEETKTSAAEKQSDRGGLLGFGALVELLVSAGARGRA